MSTDALGYISLGHISHVLIPKVRSALIFILANQMLPHPEF